MSLYYTVNIATLVFSLAVKVLLMMKEEGWGAFQKTKEATMNINDHYYYSGTSFHFQRLPTSTVQTSL